MPVLPEVASISVSPGLIAPRFSASTIIDSAGRSLTDPAGLLPSSLPRIKLDVVPGNRCSRTSGVRPTVSESVGYVISISKNRAHPLYWTRPLPSAALHKTGSPAARAGLRAHGGLTWGGLLA